MLRNIWKMYIKSWLSSRLATSRPLGERSEPFLAASVEFARGLRARHMKSDEGLF